MNRQRIERLRQLIDKNDIDGFLVSKPENIRYLSGFTGGSDARLLLSASGNYIFTDSRYREQVGRECPGWQLCEERPPGFEKLQEASRNCKRMGVESHYVTYQTYLDLENKLGTKIAGFNGFIEGLRLCKDESELNCLRQAAEIGDAVFNSIITKLKPGQSEMQVANQIGFLLKEKGCSKEGFDTIVVSAENAALPHGQPGHRILQSGDMVTMDFGGFYHGYTGDMTRTVTINLADRIFRDRYLKVLEAQQTGVAMVKAGVRCKEVDQAVRNCLKKYDLDQYFLHSTGHGIGLEIHEQPRISPLSEEVLMENMTVTIEPGIYIPGWGGIRIEDSVIVKGGGCEVLTHSDRSMLIV